MVHDLYSCSTNLIKHSRCPYCYNILVYSLLHCTGDVPLPRLLWLLKRFQCTISASPCLHHPIGMQIILVTEKGENNPRISIGLFLNFSERLKIEMRTTETKSQ